MSEPPDTLAVLSNRVDALEKRVQALEHPAEAAISRALPEVTPSRERASENLETGNVFPTIGRAMLGIAGAYVLRAVSEAGFAPRLVVIGLAIAYAFGWLAWGARTSRRLSQAIYAGTSAIILASMLWENTLSLKVLSPMVSAGVLAAFLTLATVLARASSGMWIAQTVAMVIAAALAFTTHHVLPFLVAILIGVFAIEVAKLQNSAQSVRPWMMLIADAAICGFVFIYAGPQSARGEYPELSSPAVIGMSCALFAVNGICTAIRSIVQGEKLTIFDALQLLMAYLLAAASVLSIAPHAGVVTWGVICLALSGALYFSTFTRLRHLAERRNFQIYGWWGAALLIAGSFWAFPRTASAGAPAIAAVVALYFGRRAEPEVLRLHGTVFLVSGLLLSGLPVFVFNAIGGPWRHTPDLSALVITACAVTIAILQKQGGDETGASVLRFIPALVATAALIALLVYGVLALGGARMQLDVHHVAFLRTLTICMAALGLAFGGPRWGRSELTHLAYAVLAFVAAKLLFEDLRHGHMEFIAGSIALFAVALIAAPRLVRLGAKLHGAGGPQGIAQTGS